MYADIYEYAQIILLQKQWLVANSNTHTHQQCISLAMVTSMQQTNIVVSLHILSWCFCLHLLSLSVTNVCAGEKSPNPDTVLA